MITNGAAGTASACRVQERWGEAGEDRLDVLEGFRGDRVADLGAPPAGLHQLSWNVGQTIAPALLLGLLSAGSGWLWATTIGVCLIIFLGINRLTPGSGQRARARGGGVIT
jgi:hypothetical protein